MPTMTFNLLHLLLFVKTQKKVKEEMTLQQRQHLVWWKTFEQDCYPLHMIHCALEASFVTIQITTDLIVDQQFHWRHWCLGESLLLVSAEVLRCDVGLQQSVFDEDGQRSQDEGGKQIHVDVVPHAVQFPDEWETAMVFHCDHSAFANQFYI